MKEYLKDARQLYMDLWAFHLESLLDYRKSGDLDHVLKRVSDRSMELGQKYERAAFRQFAGISIVNTVDEVERIIKNEAAFD